MGHEITQLHFLSVTLYVVSLKLNKKDFLIAWSFACLNATLNVKRFFKELMERCHLEIGFGILNSEIQFGNILQNLVVLFFPPLVK